MNKKNYKIYIWQHDTHIAAHVITAMHCNSAKECWKLITSEVQLDEKTTLAVINNSSYKDNHIIFARQVGKNKNWWIGAIYSFPTILNKEFVNGLYKKYLAKKQGYSSWAEYLDVKMQKQEIDKSIKQYTAKTNKKKTYKVNNKIYNNEHKIKKTFITTLDSLDEHQLQMVKSEALEYDEIYKKEYDEICKKEALNIFDIDKTWFRDMLACKTFPARSQKIKGLRYSSSVLERLVIKDYIDKAIVISEEVDLEVKHYCNNIVNDGKSYLNSSNKRITLDEVIQHLVNNFTRPCPMNPEHGFVDSRLINNKEEALEIIEEIRATNEIPEMIVMPKIDCEYSGVICPDRIAFGYKNDGATQGLNSIGIALSIPPEGIEKIRNNFWSSKDWPFAEVLYNGNDKPILVQLRSGPSMTVEAKKVKIVEVYNVDSSMGLIEWGKEAKKIREKVAELNNNNDSDIENTIAVWHPNGEFLSHFAVHCRTESSFPIVPYITSTEKPIINSIIEMGVKGKVKYSAIKEGLILGLEAPITAASHSSKEAKEDLHSFLGGLHISSIADLGDEFTAKYIGYIWGIGVRLISALPFGEAIYREKSRDRTTEIIGEDNKLIHTRDYSKIWKLGVETILIGLIECDSSFLDKGLNWGSTYGGQKWSNCTASLLSVYEGMRRFINLPSNESHNNMIEKINIMVNEAHNGGWWLDKISTKKVFDDASLLPHFLLSPKRAFEVKESKIGMFQIKLKTMEILKKLGVIENIEEEKEKLRVEREKKEKVKKQLKEIEKLKKEEEKKKLQKETEEKVKELEGNIGKLKKELGEFSIEGQYYINQDSNNNAILHIQIESDVKVGKSYGASIDINVGNGGEGTLLYSNYISYGLVGYKESLATKGLYKYSPIMVWKGKKIKGVCYLVTIKGVIIPIKDSNLFNLMNKLENAEEKGVEDEDLF